MKDAGDEDIGCGKDAGDEDIGCGKDAGDEDIGCVWEEVIIEETINFGIGKFDL